jgi:hypothetical protein
VRRTLVVFHPPSFHDPLGLRPCREPMRIQAFCPERSVERLHGRIVRRFRWPGKGHPHSVLTRPQFLRLSGVQCPEIYSLQLNLRETVNIFEKTGLIWGTIAPKRDCFDLEKRLSGRAKLFVPSNRAWDFISLKPLSRENLRFCTEGSMIATTVLETVADPSEQCVLCKSLKPLSCSCGTPEDSFNSLPGFVF